MNTTKAFGLPTQYCIIPTDSDRDTPNKLFLGGVPIQATEKELEEFFSQFGTVKDVRIVTDRVTAECKGYGFVTFDENENIDELLEKKAIRMKGKKIRIRRAIRRHGSQFDYLNSSPKVSPPVIGMPFVKSVSPTPNFGSTILSPPPSPDSQVPATSAPFINTQFTQEMLSPAEQLPQVILPPLQIPMNEMMMANQHYPPPSNLFNSPVFHSPPPNPVVYLPRPCSHLQNSYNVHLQQNPYSR